MASKKNFSSASSSASLTPWLGIATIIILLDQISKITINKLFAYGTYHPVTSFFNLVLVYNKGAAFSFLASESGWQRYLFTGIGIGAALFITYLLKRHAGQRLFCWALSRRLSSLDWLDVSRRWKLHNFRESLVRTWMWLIFPLTIILVSPRIR